MDYRNVLAYAICVVIIYIVVTYIHSSITKYKFRREHGCRDPPSYPQPERIIGYALSKQLIEDGKNKQRLEATAQRSELIGNTFQAVSMGQSYVLTVDPENVKAILSTNFKDFDLGERAKAFEPLLGSGIFTADGTHWEYSRALVRPNFTKTQIANLNTFENHIQELVSCIPKDGSTVDLQPLFFNLTLDSATEFLFGESVHSQLSAAGSEARQFSEAFDYAQSKLPLRAFLGRLMPLVRDKKFDKCCAIVHKFADSYVSQALESRSPCPKIALEKNTYNHPERYIFLSELVQQTSDPIQLRNEMLNVLLAGRDTTASLLSNVFHALARHPGVWQALQDEIAFLNGQPPRYEELNDMQYLKWVLNEALRLWPPVPGNRRRANKNTTLPRGGGPDGLSPVFIPKGSMVVYSAYSIHRRRDIWGEDANSFNPLRWAPDASHGPLRPGWAFLPFNGGPRVCVGQRYALTEASYAVVRLLQTFSRIENRDRLPWVEGLGITLCSGEGTHVALELRG